MSEPRSPGPGPTPKMAMSRVELTLDSGHNLPPMKHELNLNRQDVEIMELKRLCASAHGDSRRKALESEIENLTGDAKSAESKNGDGGSDGSVEGGTRNVKGRQGARPWSARPMSARQSNVQVMKTIPESKQHVRPLSRETGPRELSSMALQLECSPKGWSHQATHGPSETSKRGRAREVPIHGL